MKRITAFVLMLAFLIAYVPAFSAFATQHAVASKEYYTDFNAENGYIGNYALISNNDASLTSYVGSGDLTGLIDTGDDGGDDPTSNSDIISEEIHGDAESTQMLSTTEQKASFGTLSPTAQYKVGDSFYWFHIADAYTMYDPYVETIGSNYNCRAVGDHCYVWASTQYDSTAYAIPTDAAAELAAEFDEIYSKIVNAFGIFGVDGAKVNILAHNLSSGVESYFYDFEYKSLGNNQGQYFFHVDTYPTMTEGNGTWDVAPVFEPMASAFVKMLTTLRTDTRVPDWMKQVLSEAAIGLCYGEDYTYDRIMNWATETESYTNGRSIYQWDPSDLNGYTAYHYMFGQYLRVQYGNYGVFGNILDYYASNNDTTGATVVPTVFEGTALDGMSIGEIVQAFRMATCIIDDAQDSIYGFGGEDIFNFIPKTLFVGTSANVYAGGCLLVKTTDSSVFLPPDDASSRLSYVGITISVDDLPSVHSVKFYDWDETLLQDELVFHGYAATAPAQPYREGHTFIGWDKDFSNVTESLVIHAEYSEGETYRTITLYNDDRTTVLGTISVISGFAAELPTEPLNEGYKFTGWTNEDGSYYDFRRIVTEDFSLYATWVRTVTMYGFKSGVYSWGSFSTGAPDEFTEYIPIDSEIIRNMLCSVYLDGNIYGFNADCKFIEIDFNDKTAAVVGEASVNESLNIMAFFDMTYDYTTDTAYITYANTSYTCYLAKVNLKTGKITNVATAPEYYMAIACNKAGDMYAMTSHGGLVRVNKDNARNTPIGDTGFSTTNGGSVYLSSMTFDYATGNLYWSAKSYDTFEPHLLLIDTTTAHAADLGTFTNAASAVAIFIPYTYDVTTYYTVDFVDYDGTIISTQQVAEGQDAVAPADPERYGYEFTGWNNDFTNVQSDLRIVAQYSELEKFTVTFADWDMTVLDTQEVYSGYAATEPTSPVREGYVFTGWDKDFSCILSNLIVIAQYVKEGELFTVTFVDWDGTVLKTEEVTSGASATPPVAPVREDYIFIGWDNDYTNITSDLTVTAQYQEFGDINGDGNVNTGDATFLLRYSVGLVTLTDEQMLVGDMNGDEKVNTGDAVYILRMVVGLV